MKISVVIIAFNLEKYIEEAIHSVLSQTRKADEIIVMDDCSTDTTASIIGKFSDQVKYYRMDKNSGALLAALQGIRHTNGDIICMLDGDDTWALNKLLTVENEFVSQQHLMLLSHQHICIDAKGKRLNIKDETHANIQRILKINYDKHELSENLKETILAQKGYWLGSAYSFKRKVFDIEKFEEQLGLFEEGNIKYTYLDLAIAPFLVLSNLSEDVGYTDGTYFNYRIHSSSSLSDNLTVDKALLSLEKGKTINLLILHIMVHNKAADKYIIHRKVLLNEYLFLGALYKKIFCCSQPLSYIIPEVVDDKQKLERTSKICFSCLSGS